MNDYLKIGTKVKFNKKISKKREEPLGRTRDEEWEIHRDIEGFVSEQENEQLELLYSIRKSVEAKESEGIICGVRSLGFERKVTWKWFDGGYESPDELGRETECTVRKKCYLVAVNLKNLVYVLCEDVEEIKSDISGE